jgi:hypothetical protein
VEDQSPAVGRELSAERPGTPQSRHAIIR